MIRRIVLCLALACGSGTALAQQATCTLYKVNTSMLNVAEQAAGERYIDALYDGDVACVTRTATAKGATWGFVAQKLDSPTETTAVQGWAPMKDLQQITNAEAASLLAEAAPTSPPPAGPKAPPANAPASAGAAAPPVAAAPPAAAAAPAANSAAHANAAAPVRPEDVLHFDQPIPFGPYPVNGHSIKDMIDNVPLFSPVEGLDESTWKKHCTSCHQWNKDRLCQQALSYVRQPRFVLRVPHPFGGTFKLALMRWAKSGCD
jgi:hypothetical protein